MVFYWRRYGRGVAASSAVPISEGFLLGFACEAQHRPESLAKRRWHLGRIGRRKIPEVRREGSGPLGEEDGAGGRAHDGGRHGRCTGVGAGNLLVVALAEGDSARLGLWGGLNEESCV